jgi:uncharacterized OsmC-like protein
MRARGLPSGRLPVYGKGALISEHRSSRSTSTARQLKGFTIHIDEPTELGGGNAYPNPQEHLMAALNACMMVGYVVLCALHGIALEKLEIQTQGDIGGFFGLDESIPAGYRSLTCTVRIKGDASEEQFAKIHQMVMATSPNYYNITRSVTLKPTLVIE